MVMQAGAERVSVAGERPDTADTLATIEKTGREALVEMRRLLGLCAERMRRSRSPRNPASTGSASLPST
jgi:hypothetical protein